MLYPEVCVQFRNLTKDSFESFPKKENNVFPVALKWVVYSRAFYQGILVNWTG